MFSSDETPIDEVTEAQIWIQQQLEASSAVLAAFPAYIGPHPAPRSLVTYPILTHDPHLVGEALVVVAASQGVYHLFSSKFGNMTAATDTTQPALPSAPSVPTRPPGA